MNESSDNTHKETITTWNKVANLYEEKFMHLDVYNESYNALIACFPLEEADVFEIGCGPGNISSYILPHRPMWRWKGIDAAENMMALANKNNPTAQFEVGDARHLHLSAQSQDIFIAGFCVPYLSPSETVQLFSEANQFLRKGGIIYLSYVPGSPDQSGFQTSSTGDRSYFYFFYPRANQ